LGLGLAFLFDSLDHSLKDRAEAEAYLKLPVLASVSRFRN
jgi:capsular polysaccharide biosynthesis protein